MNKKKPGAPGIKRLLATIALVCALLLGIAVVMPWMFPYDRLEHLYGLNAVTVEAGHPGGAFILYCAPINGSPDVELMVNGKVYAKAREISKEQYAVTLGPELFEKPGKLELRLKETFAAPISLRSNAISLYVEE